jgi:hypothetical protein
LGPAPAAERAGGEGGQDQQQRAGEGGDQPQRRQGITQDGPDRVRGERDPWRKIHRPEPKMATHGEVEQLVPMKAVRRRAVHRQV